jgi:hypothetical protein
MPTCTSCPNGSLSTGNSTSITQCYFKSGSVGNNDGFYDANGGNRTLSSMLGDIGVPDERNTDGCWYSP